VNKEIDLFKAPMNRSFVWNDNYGFDTFTTVSRNKAKK